MRIAVRRLVLCVLFCVGLGCWSAGASEAASGDTAAASGAFGSPLVVPAVQALDGGQQAQAQEEALRSSPEAVIAREVSSSAYEGLDAEQAGRVDVEAFPAVIDDPSGGPPSLAAGQRITGFPAANAASVELGGGARGVIESLAPMATENAAGQLVPIDLGLQVQVGAFEPATPLVGVRIPKLLGGGVQLPALGVSLTPVSAQGVALAGSEGALDGASVIYANTQMDMDTVVKPVVTGLGGGVEIDSFLRSSESPEQLFFRVGLPEGASLSQAVGGSGSVEIVEGGVVLATVLAPSAQDAAGTPVPVSMTVSGDLLSVVVAHHAGEWRYPIDVDPTVTDTNHGSNNWGFSNTEGPEFAASGTYIGMHNCDCNQPDFIGQWAQVYYLTQGASRIYSYWTKTRTANGQIMGAEVYIGSKEGLEGEAATTLPKNATTETQKCTEAACAFPSEEQMEKTAGRNENAAVLKGEVDEDYDSPDNEFTFEDDSESSSVGIVQYALPSVSLDTSTETVEGAINPLYGSGRWVATGSKWPEGNVKLGLEAKETGIGVDAVEWKSPTEPKWEPYYFPNYYSGPITVGKCHGVQCEQCVGVVCTAGEKEPITTALYGLPEGEDTVEVKAFNATGASGTASAKVKVDNAPPHSITLSGLSSGGEVLESQKQLHLSANATDGSGTTPSSGVASIALEIDGDPVGTRSGSCTPGPCTATGEWALNMEGYAAGKHTLTVTATDYAGNSASEEIPFTVHRASPLAMGPGRVDPVTGEFSLQATDVSVGSAGSPLTVSRSYRSQHLTSGSSGPLGPQWYMSVGGEQSIITTPDGNAELTNTAGQQTVFTQNKKGGFNSPSGDTDVKLTEAMVKGAAALLLHSGSTTTTFEHPTSGSASVWTPAITEGVGGTNTSTFAFTTVEGVTRPTEVLAPVPSGVSCSPTLTRGCRALTFKYATSTTATGEGASEWGEYKHRLSSISFTGWEPAKKEITTTVVAEYAYDAKGRLRAEWDPGISPALKTTYGYDTEGHVTAIAPAGQQPWLFTYGTGLGDPGTGRLLSVTRPAASTALGSGVAPNSTTAPSLSTSTPAMGTALSVTNGSWSNSPLSYGYQWERCSYTGAECAAIPGASNQSYTPVLADNGHALLAQVTASNAAGSTVALSAASSPVPIAAPTYSSAFGSSGTGAGQLDEPTSTAIAPNGDVWVADPVNHRLQEFSSSGTFIEAIGWGVSTGKEEFQTCTSSCKAGLAGLGAGEFSNPEGLAVNQNSGDIYVADSTQDRIQELSATGAYITSFGSYGTGAGELYEPHGITLDSSGDVWVADTNNCRVEEFSASGAFLKSYGEPGTKLGQFEGTFGVAIAGGNVYVTDIENQRVQELKPATGEWVREFGDTGSETEKLSYPWAIASDPLNGDVYVTSYGNSRIQAFTPEGKYVEGFGSFGSGHEQLEFPSGLAINSSTGALYLADEGNDRIDIWAPSGPTQEPVQNPPALGTSAVSTIDYQVPVSGSGAPYALGAKEAEAWAQTDTPAEATAIFPADEPMGWPAKDYKRATVVYLDAQDRAVNVANPAGGISTTEYNANNDVVRTLSADNRKAALEAGSESAADAKLWDSESTYSSEGSELQSTLGPQHNVKLPSGTQAQARLSTHYYYEEGAPSEGGPYELVTKTTSAALLADKEEVDMHTQTISYSGQDNLGWRLRKPTATTTDPSGLKLVHSVMYEPKTGDVSETRLPAAGAPGEETGYSFGFQFGKSGTESGQFKEPSGIAVNASGDTYVLDTGNNRVQEFGPEGKFLRKFGASGTGNGELKAPEGIAVDAGGKVWVADTGNNRVEEFSETGGYLAQFGSTETLKAPQGIAVDSEGNIWVADTGNSRVREWAKEEGSETFYVRRTFGTAGTGEEQFKEPQGIAIGAEGNVYVADTGNSRVDEWSAKGKFVRKFASEGTGTDQLKAPHSVATDSEGHVWVADTANNRLEEFSATGTFMQTVAKEGTGEGQLKGPKGIAIDLERNAWVADTANSRVAQWTPNGSGYEAPGKGSPHTTQTIYYTAAANSTYTACGEYPEWAGLPCQTQPAKQPEGSLPKLPVTTYTYNLWDEPETTTETAGSATRTTTVSHDAAGRVVSSAISSTTGTALPTLTDEYSTTTGALVKQSTTTEGKTQSITSAFNTLGQLEGYTDAEGNTSTYTYDIDGRPETTNDGKGTQTFAYNSSSGFLSTLKDSAAGTFTEAEDVEGELLSQSYPNGMTATYTKNTNGEPTKLEYLKTTHCTSGCTWYSETIVPSIHGQQVSQTNTFTSNSDTYDTAGRLTQVQETPAGEGCTTRIYSYDNDTNRTAETIRKPGSKGECASEGGTTESHTYDEADRLNSAGVAYEAFGNTTSLPAADAGGTELTSSFYSDNQVATQTQNGETLDYYLDPTGRTIETVSTGKTSSSIISHYMNASESPAWTEEHSAGHWTRYIPGMTGLAAIQTNGGTPVLALANLHGDIVATAALSETETKLLSATNTTEYGVPTTGTPAKYSWLGADQRPTELPTGIVAMGARSYVPQLGRYLQTDPVEGGSADAYAYTHGDPVDETDLTGQTTESGPPAWLIALGKQTTEEAIAVRAAEEAAARAAAERKAAEAEAAEAAYWAYWSNYTAYWTSVMTAEENQPGIGEEEGGGDGPLAYLIDGYVRNERKEGKSNAGGCPAGSKGKSCGGRGGGSVSNIVEKCAYGSGVYGLVGLFVDIVKVTPQGAAVTCIAGILAP
jgi:RHS repeat-associated protein